MQHLVPIAIFMSLHGPAGACILVASGLQFMYFQYNVYMGFAHQLGCKKEYSRSLIIRTALGC